MHGNMTGAYRVPNLAIRNRVVMTNKTPSGLVRGFGGPQVYFALERLIQNIAVTLGLDPLDVIRRNLVDRFPYRCPAGAVLDSGDYHAAVEQAVSEGGLDALYRRREEARAAGRLYGIGFAAIVEPSISNMGYITTVLALEERQKAGPKGGAQAAAAVALDPLGGISVIIDSLRASPIDGRISEIVPMADPGSRSIEVKIDLPFEDGLRSGMFGRAQFIHGSKTVLLLPLPF